MPKLELRARWLWFKWWVRGGPYSYRKWRMWVDRFGGL